MKLSNARTTLLTMAIGLAGLTAGCGSPAHDDALPVLTPTGGAATPSITSPSPAASLPASLPAAPLPASAPVSLPATATQAGRAPDGPVARCSGKELAADLQPPAAAGDRRSAALSLRNTGSKPCSLSGFPDLQLLGHADDPISTLVVHTGPAGSVRLAPGATAWAALIWTTKAAADEPAGGCEPAAGRLAVFAPSDENQLDVTYSAGPICEHGRVEAGAFSGVPNN